LHQDLHPERPLQSGQPDSSAPRSASHILVPTLEDLHDDPPDVLSRPLVEDCAKEDAERFPRHGAIAHTALRCRLRLYERDEADVLGFDFLEEAVKLMGMPDVLGMHDAQAIHQDLPSETGGCKKLGLRSCLP
jgi:hypothetical protein